MLDRWCLLNPSTWNSKIKAMPMNLLPNILGTTMAHILMVPLSNTTSLLWRISRHFYLGLTDMILDMILDLSKEWKNMP